MVLRIFKIIVIKIINIDTWNKLKPEQQELLKESTRLALQRNREAAMNLTKKLTTGLEKAGKNTITYLSADERKAFYDAVQPVYTKMAKKMAEEGKIAVRNHRRDANDIFKEMKNEKEMSEDEMFKAQDEVQKVTDDFIARIDSVTAEKEKEILEF